MAQDAPRRMKMEDFEIKEAMAKGSFGTVYRVVRKEDGRVFAMKQVNLDGMNKAQQEEAIDEARVLASLDCKYVIRYYDCFIDGSPKQLCIIMGFAAGGSLYHRIRAGRGGLPEASTWKYFIQTLLALSYMHGRRVVHRDIKSLNVFLDSSDSVKLGDLGIAKVLGRHTDFMKTMVGTPYYLSPELCEDKPYDERTDIWALGVVLYECLTGRHPFDAANEGALIRKIMAGVYEPPRGAPPALTELVRLCLTKDRAKRPDAKSLLAHPAISAKAASLGIDLTDLSPSRNATLAPRLLAPTGGPVPPVAPPSTVAAARQPPSPYGPYHPPYEYPPLPGAPPPPKKTAPEAEAAALAAAYGARAQAGPTHAARDAPSSRDGPPPRDVSSPAPRPGAPVLSSALLAQQLRQKAAIQAYERAYPQGPPPHNAPSRAGMPPEPPGRVVGPYAVDYAAEKEAAAARGRLAPGSHPGADNAAVRAAVAANAAALRAAQARGRGGGELAEVMRGGNLDAPFNAHFTPKGVPLPQRGAAGPPPAPTTAGRRPEPRPPGPPYAVLPDASPDWGAYSPQQPYPQQYQPEYPPEYDVPAEYDDGGYGAYDERGYYIGPGDDGEEAVYDAPVPRGIDPPPGRPRPASAGGRPGGGGYPAAVGFAPPAPLPGGYRTSAQEQAAVLAAAVYEPPQFGRRRSPDIGVTGPNMRDGYAPGPPTGLAARLAAGGGNRGGGFGPGGGGGAIQASRGTSGTTATAVFGGGASQATTYVSYR